MTEELMLEILKDIQGRVGDLAQGQAQMRIELAALGSQLADGGASSARQASDIPVPGFHNRIADIERRIDRIEKHLALTLLKL